MCRGSKMKLRTSPLKSFLYLFLMTCLLVSIFLRIDGLGEESFFIDEFYHVYAARSFLNDGSFSLPSGEEYRRGAVYTLFVSLCFWLWDVSEFSARLPSVFFGLGYLLAYYYITATMFNKRIAIVSTLILAFSHTQIYYSRECRMYSLFQLTYLLEVFLIYLLLNRKHIFFDTRRKGGRKGGAFNTFILLVSILFLFFISAQLQKINYMIVPSMVVFGMYVFLDKQLAYKMEDNMRRVVLAGLIVGTIIAVAQVNQRLIETISREFVFRYTPKWALPMEHDVLFYLRSLKHDYFLLWILIPVGGLIAICKFKRLGFYLISIYLIPLIIQSYLQIKAPRYILYVYPFGVILVGIALCRLLEVNVFQNAQKLKDTSANATKVILVIMIVVFVTSNHFLAKDEYKSFLPKKPGWKKLSGVLKPYIKEKDLVISDNSVAALYYLGRCDYVVDQNALEISEHMEYKNIKGQYLDYYTNAIQLSGIEDFRKVIGRERPIWVLFGHGASGFDEIKEYVRARGEKFRLVASEQKVEVYALRSNE